MKIQYLKESFNELYIA